jgi:hypothetical protein
MYIVFRCDCGRAVYSKQGTATKKCVCGKTLKVKERRILAITEEAEQASAKVRELQEEKYGGAVFTTADKVPNKR